MKRNPIPTLALALSLSACAAEPPPRSPFEQSVYDCSIGSFTSCDGARQMHLSLEQRTELRRTEITSIRERCTLGLNPNACFRYGRELFGFGTSLDVIAIKPDPAQGLSLLRPVCQHNQTGYQPDDSAQVCELLAAALWQGLGAPEDKVAARQFATRAMAPPPQSNDPDRELRIIAKALRQFPFAEHAERRFEQAQSLAAKGLLDEAVPVFLEALATGSHTVVQYPGAWSKLAETLWEPAVERELAAGRVVVAVARARFMGEKVPLLPNRHEWSARAARKALDVLARMPEPPANGRTALFRKQLEALFRGNSPPSARPTETATNRTPPRWVFSSTNPACAWLVEGANAITRDRSQPAMDMPLGSVTCQREEKRWTTEESTTYTEMVDPGEPPKVRTVRRTVTTRSLGCGRNGQSECSYQVDESVEVPGTGRAPVYAKRVATRSIQHRQFVVAVKGVVTWGGVGGISEGVSLNVAPKHDAETGLEYRGEILFSKYTFDLLVDEARRNFVSSFDNAWQYPYLDAKALGELHRNANLSGAAAEESLLAYADKLGTDADLLRPIATRYGVHPWDVWRILHGTAFDEATLDGRRDVGTLDVDSYALETPPH